MPCRFNKVKIPHYVLNYSQNSTSVKSSSVIIYLLANLTAQRPITKLARVKKRNTNSICTKQDVLYNSNNNNNNSINSNQNRHLREKQQTKQQTPGL
jgi:hypothetical protein